MVLVSWIPVIAMDVPPTVKSSSVSTEVELHSAPAVPLRQPKVPAANNFAVSVADQMGVLAVALGVPLFTTQALSPLVFFARTRTR